MSKSRLFVSSLAACCLASCAASNVYTGADAGAHRFSQIGRPAASAQAQAQVQAKPQTSSAPVKTAAAAPTIDTAPSQRSTMDSPRRLDRTDAAASYSLDDARRRVVALLSAEGFSPEPTADGTEISASRMAVGDDNAREAVCAVHALTRPRMYAANIDVRLDPNGVVVDAHFEEMDQNLVSGELSKHACASRGVLEAQIRRAATGG